MLASSLITRAARRIAVPARFSMPLLMHQRSTQQKDSMPMQINSCKNTDSCTFCICLAFVTTARIFCSDSSTIAFDLNCFTFFSVNSDTNAKLKPSKTSLVQRLKPSVDNLTPLLLSMNIISVLGSIPEFFPLAQNRRPGEFT